MANLRFVRPNRLRREAYRRRAWIAGAGLPVVVIVALVHPLLCLPVMFTGGFLWQRQERLLKGALGEDRTLGLDPVHAGTLVHLSDEYVVFNQVEIPSERGKRREADFVVVGPNGVFVIETKYYRGLIEGREHEPLWTRYFHDRSKGVSVPNPILQVRRTMRTLSAYLADKGVRVWLEPIVVFAHPYFKMSVCSESVPVLQLHELAAHVAAHRPRHPVRCQAEVIDALRALIDGQPTTQDRPNVPLRAGQPLPMGRIMQDAITDRVDSFMAYDIKAALRRELWKKRLGLANPQPIPLPTNSEKPLARPLRSSRVRKLPDKWQPRRRRRRHVRIVECQVEWLEEVSISEPRGVGKRFEPTGGDSE